MTAVLRQEPREKGRLPIPGPFTPDACFMTAAKQTCRAWRAEPPRSAQKAFAGAGKAGGAVCLAGLGLRGDSLPRTKVSQLYPLSCPAGRMPSVRG